MADDDFAAGREAGAATDEGAAAPGGARGQAPDGDAGGARPGAGRRARRAVPPVLRRLRRQFVAMATMLVAIVLGVALASSYASTYRTQHHLTAEALERAVSSPEALALTVTVRVGPAPDDAATPRPEDAMVAEAVVDDDGAIVARSALAELCFDDETLDELVSESLAAQADSGSLPGRHVDFRRAGIEAGTSFSGTLVALVDTTSRDAFLERQALDSVLIFAAATLGALAVAWVLSDVALRPVEEAWERQRRFLADASHELKTPLAVILANAQILQRDRSLPDGSRRWVDSTADEAERMKELVGELLTLARADEASATGGEAAERQDVDLSEMVESVALEFDAVAFERGCELSCEAEPGIHVRADRASLRRALASLVDNATKYADHGSTVRVRLRRQGRHVVYTVNNQGEPVSAEDLPHLFDRFYRTDRARTRADSGGFGLGLAIARGIVEAHGGTIRAQSTREDGTTFTVTL